MRELYIKKPHQVGGAERKREYKGHRKEKDQSGKGSN
jgi:hypothetical protein